MEVVLVLPAHAEQGPASGSDGMQRYAALTSILAMKQPWPSWRTVRMA